MDDIRLCPQACPTFGNASYSIHIAIFSFLGFLLIEAVKAVGISATPVVILNPFFLRTFIRISALLYS